MDLALVLLQRALSLPREKLVVTHTSAVKDFLLAAKEAEWVSLNQLSATADLVVVITDLVHELQRERGMATIFLASAAGHYAEQLPVQQHRAMQAEIDFRTCIFRQQDGIKQQAHAMRLLHNIAYVLHGLDRLPALRMGVLALKVDIKTNAEAWTQVIAGLLAVVFEAADVAMNPSVSRVLVALFNVIQSKEYAGQERAWMAAGFAQGRFDAGLIERLHQLQTQQQQGLDVALAHTPEVLCKDWLSAVGEQSHRDVERMRKMTQALDPSLTVATELCEVWYDLATQRIDALHVLELGLVQAMQAEVKLQTQQVEKQLREQRQLFTAPDLDALYESWLPSAFQAVPNTQEAPPARALYELLQEQAEHIRSVTEALGEAKQALQERKLIDRAKAELMQRFGLSETEAFRKLQQHAMSSNKRLADVASALLSVTNSARKSAH